jgi:hypothetical protein
MQNAWKVYSNHNWKEATGVMLTFAVYFTFFPGVMLQNKLTFISSFSWFVITIITYATAMDFIGRFIASKCDIISKRAYLVACLIRVVVFTTTYLLTF